MQTIIAISSLHFNGHFPGGRGLASTRMSPFRILLELRVIQLVVTNGAIRRAKLQSKCHHQQTNTKSQRQFIIKSFFGLANITMATSIQLCREND